MLLLLLLADEAANSTAAVPPYPVDTLLHAAADSGIPPLPRGLSSFDLFLRYHFPQGPFNWSLLAGTLLAFLSQLSSIGKGLQKVGVQTLPELSLQSAVLWQYLSSTKWRNGVLLDILGAIFGFISLTILPISVAQPIFCNGLVLLAIYSHFVLRERVARREWRAIGMCFTGTVLLALTLVPRDWSRTNIGHMQLKLSCVLILTLPLLVALECALRRAKRRGVPNRSFIEMLTGVQAGLCIGVGNASLASGLQSTSRSWLDHVAAEHVSSEAWPQTSLSSGVWLHLGSAAAFVILGATLNGLHPVFANRGYRHGRVVLISTHTALTSMATGVGVGVLVLVRPSARPASAPPRRCRCPAPPARRAHAVEARVLLGVLRAARAARAR